MVSQHSDPVYRTTPERTARMMAIMLGICVAGGAIFFGMWDYWISAPPPVAEMMAGEGPAPVTVVPTGVEIPVSLSFVESADFRVLAFNALPGEPGSNPDIRAEPGDRIVFDVVNDGISFHAFGVTADESGFGGIYPGTEIGTGTAPLTGGEGGTSEFIAPEDGIYYYICTVAGHREQGMVGRIIVGGAEAPEEGGAMEGEAAGGDAMDGAAGDAMEGDAMEEEGAQASASATMTATVTLAPAGPAELDGPISLPAGSALPGCADTDECYLPAHALAAAGDEVTWSNDDTAAHTVTSGEPGAPDGLFDSGLFLAGATFSHTFEEPGEYPYYCLVHPWMAGSVTVG